MSLVFRIAVAMLFAALCGPLWALNESQFQSLDIRDGLPSQQINSLAQDRDGHLWIGTKDGLARYDGRRFQIYRHTPGDASSLPSNYVGAVHVDGRNRLWVAVEGYGVYRLNADGIGFSSVPLAGHSRGLDVWAMVSDASGALWFGSFGQGLFRRTADGRVTRFMPTAGAPGLPDENVLSLAVGSDQSLWIGTSSGLVLWRKGRFSAIANQELPSPVVLSVIPDAEYGIWLGTQAGLALINRDGRISLPPWRTQLSHNAIMGVLRESAGVRWFVTSKGLNRLEGGNVQVLYPKHSFYTAYQDQQGGFWFGSDQGLVRQPKSWRYFNSHQAEANAKGLRIQRPMAYAALPDGSLLLTGSRAVVDRFWPETGRIEPYLFNAQAVRSSEFRAVMRDDRGQIWLGGSVELLKLSSARAAPEIWNQTSSDATLLGPARHLLQLPDSRIWIAYYGGGLQARDADGHVLHNITPKSGHGLQFPDTEQLLQGPDGQLWMVGGEGLMRWDEPQQRLRRVPGSPDERLYSAAIAPDNSLWIGALGRLERYRWHAETQSVRRMASYAGDDGLPAVEISGIAFDGHGDVWLSTSRGLLRFDIKQRRSRLYGINDGLISQEFDVRAPLINPRGFAVALSKRAVVSFRPDLMQALQTPLRLVLEQVSVRRQEDQVTLDANAAIEMQPGDRDLSIEAQLLNFEDVSAHRYRSRLSGFDPDWIEMGNSGTRVFSKLAPGHYQLQVIATNAEGLWSPPRRVEIHVLPPWWRTWWAYMAYALASVCAIGLLLLAHRRRLKQKHAEQMQTQQRQMLLRSSEAKSQFLANLGHEIRTPMTGVLGMTELLLAGQLPDKPKSQVQSIQKAGEHLLRLMNDALDLSKIEAGQITLDDQVFDVRAVLREIQTLLAPLAVQKGLSFELQLQDELPQAYSGDSGRIRQILFNLGNNAIKFTAAGSVRIMAQPLQPHGLEVKVIDTGPGMSVEQQAKLFQRFVQADGLRTTQQFGGSGLGLAISKELANLMGGDIHLESTPGVGSQFTLNLPLQEALLSAQNAPSSQTQATGLARPAKVLLVEDDEMIITVISQLFKAQGHEVSIARNALEALVQAAQKPFDAIFCDIDLPGMSGLDLTRIWRQQGLQTPIVALTARTQSDAEADCMQAGMTAFLRKPVSGAQLRQALQDLRIS
jgi:signal transduction histidine kinase/ligand-binding sensor domain-containing protein/CheY-like chemotaxis protein